MHSRILGKTGLQIPVLSFGAGPVSTLMVGETKPRQRDVIAYAIERGIDWFDTAATYGNGESESNLGRVLNELGAGSRVRVASKVRLFDEDLGEIRSAVRRSVVESLQRLGLSRLTLLQLHNSITPRRGDEPTSLTPEDVLASGGVADAFEELRAEGLVSHLGLTGIGQPVSLAAVVRSGRFETMQVPYHLLNPSAGRDMPDDFPETNYGNIIRACADMQMGVMAIRVLAGGALADNPPSPHTFKTKFFPLELYERDRQRASRIRDSLPEGKTLPQEAICFALAHPHVHSAIVGFGDIAQIDSALAAIELESPVLSWNDIAALESNTDSD